MACCGGKNIKKPISIKRYVGGRIFFFGYHRAMKVLLILNTIQKKNGNSLLRFYKEYLKDISKEIADKKDIILK